MPARGYEDGSVIEKGYAKLNVRLKLLGVSLLFCVALASVIFAAVSTVQAYQNFTQTRQHVMEGDVNTISSWMTLPYIAHVYHVPEGCLVQELHIKSSALREHASLRFIANYYHRSLNTVLSEVRTVILQYRQKHLVCPAITLPPVRFSRYPPAWYGRDVP